MDDQTFVPLEDETTDVVRDGQSEPSAAPLEHSLQLMAAGIRPDEPMAEAVRKVMYRQYQVMLDNEAGCRGGKSIDAVHDMRVATRRLRVAFRLFGSYYKRSLVRDLEQDLRRTGRTLGAARDLDVFNKTARQYLSTLPKQQRKDLDPLLASWKRQRQIAHRELIGYFDSPRYQRLVEKLGDFLTTAGAGVAAGKESPGARIEVRHVLGSTLWQRYEAVRAFEVVLPAAPPETLHALRIEFKYLRYALEFFQEVLGSGAPQLIRQVIVAQDHLGEIQDAEVANRLLADYLAKAFKEQAAVSTLEAADLDGVTRYLSHRRDQSRQMTATFPEMWKQIDSVKFRRRLAAVLVPL
ncbi:MAG TPA: CHAD domain-containing protein [Anaerolineae bacterium]|nr:CHAD domain-containing protein [Anaerolineae bacterium]